MGKRRYKRYKIADFEPHIKGSGGIISTIATRVNCDWTTAEKWIMGSPKLKALYDAETEMILDVAESVVYGNVQAAAWAQSEAAKKKERVIVDSADAKWLLTKRGKGRGYGDAADVNLRTPEGSIEIKTVRVHLPDDEENGDE